MTSTDLIGTWTLVSHGFQNANGTYRASGDRVRGQLLYASDGAMSVLIMKKTPNREQTTERRIAMLVGDQLTLTTSPKADGHFIITWQRR